MKSLLIGLIVLSLVGCGKAPENASGQLTPTQICDLVRDHAGSAVVIIDLTATLRYTFNLYDTEVTDSGVSRVVGTEKLDMPACTVDVVNGKVNQVIYK